MKRTITSLLGALAVAAGFSLFAAPAQAYTINCYAITATPTAWPYDGSAEKCGTTAANAPTQKASGMVGALYATQTDMLPAYNYMQTAHAKFRIFNNPTEYKQFFSERAASPPTGTTALDWAFPDATDPNFPDLQNAWGITYAPTLGVAPKWTAIFVVNFKGVTLDQYGTIAQTTMHEMGHWQDVFFRNIAGGSNNFLSSSTVFQNLLKKDFSDPATTPIINQITPKCATGGAGLFSGRTDWTKIPGTAAGGFYICNGTRGNGSALNGTKYSGATNQVIMRLGYGNMFTSEREIIANLFAFWASTVDDSPHGVMSFFDSNRFGCTKLLMKRVLQDGILPTQSEMAAVVKPAAAGGGLAGCPVTGLPL